MHGLLFCCLLCKSQVSECPWTHRQGEFFKWSRLATALKNRTTKCSLWWITYCKQSSRKFRLIFRKLVRSFTVFIYLWWDFLWPLLFVAVQVQCIITLCSFSENNFVLYSVLKSWNLWNKGQFYPFLCFKKDSLNVKCYTTCISSCIVFPTLHMSAMSLDLCQLYVMFELLLPVCICSVCVYPDREERYGQPSGDICSISSQHNQVRRSLLSKTAGALRSQINLHSVPEGHIGGIHRNSDDSNYSFSLCVECRWTNQVCRYVYFWWPKKKGTWAREKVEERERQRQEMKEGLNLTKMNVRSLHLSLILSLTRPLEYKAGERKRADVIWLSLGEESKNC